MLAGHALSECPDTFLGFGNWDTRIWFIGIEEASGQDEPTVLRRLEAWVKHGKNSQSPNKPPPGGSNFRNGNAHAYGFRIPISTFATATV